jgi:hypothetical protein
VQCKVNRFAAANVQKISRDEHGASPAPLDAGNYPGINALRRFSRGGHVRNISLFSLQDQGLFEAGRRRRSGDHRHLHLGWCFGRQTSIENGSKRTPRSAEARSPLPDHSLFKNLLSAWTCERLWNQAHFC